MSHREISCFGRLPKCFARKSRDHFRRNGVGRVARHCETAATRRERSANSRKKRHRDVSSGHVCRDAASATCKGDVRHVLVGGRARGGPEWRTKARTSTPRGVVGARGCGAATGRSHLVDLDDVIVVRVVPLQVVGVGQL